MMAVGTIDTHVWVDACDDPETADNSGNDVVNPGGIIRPEQFIVSFSVRAKSLSVRLAYPTAGTVTTDPIVQVFGRMADGTWELLEDLTGNTNVTLTSVAVADLDDGTLKYTLPADISPGGALDVLVAIKTALVGTTLGSTSVIQLRPEY